MRSVIRSILCLSLVCAAPAWAFIYAGNPTLTIEVHFPGEDIDSGDVILEKVRIDHCGGGFTDYLVDQGIDPVEGWSTGIAGGDHCAAILFWGNDMVLEGPGLEIEYREPTTFVPLHGTHQGKPLTPFVVTEGVIHGGNPHLDLTIQ